MDHNSLQRIAIVYVSSNEDEDDLITDSENEHINHNLPTYRRRKRVHYSNSENRLQNAKKRMKGLQYLGFSTVDKIVKQNVIKKQREIGPACLSKTCIKSTVRHCQQLDDVARKSIFKMFWTMSWEAKLDFLKAHVTQTPIKRSTVHSCKRTSTFVYKLPYQHELLQVCRAMFISTLGINRGMLRYWLVNKNPVPSSDKKKAT